MGISFKKILSLVLVLCMVLGLSPLGSIESYAYADTLGGEAFPDIPRVIHVAPGRYNSVLVYSDGSVWTSGSNESRLLVSDFIAEKYVLRPATKLSTVKIVEASVSSASTLTTSFALFLRDDGKVMSVGYNGNGQLGNNTKTSSTEPVQVEVKSTAKFISVSAGEAHSLALGSDGTVWAWGKNDNGELGVESITESLEPVQIPESNGFNDIIAISAGSGYSLALKKDGTVWSWGDHSKGLLGYAASEKQKEPKQIPGLSNVIKISAGTNSVVVLRADGTVWTWGKNPNGGLGLGDTKEVTTPTVIPNLDGIVDVQAGSGFAIALKNNGTVWGWGYASIYQLGNNSTSDSLIPIQIQGLANIAKIAVGPTYSIAQDEDNRLYYWGYNSYGMFGDGGNADKRVPTVMPESTTYFLETDDMIKTATTDEDIFKAKAYVNYYSRNLLESHKEFLNSKIDPLLSGKTLGTTTLRDMPIGSVVSDPTWEWEFRKGPDYTGSGVTKSVDWILVSKNYSNYHLSSSATLLAKETIATFVFDRRNKADWESAGEGGDNKGVRKFLNGSSYTGGDTNDYTAFYDSFSEGFKSRVLDTPTTVTAQDKVFIPSLIELGQEKNTIPWEYFTNNASAAYLKEINSGTITYWTRTPNSGNVSIISSNGIFSGGASNDRGVRPAINLADSTKVNLIECVYDGNRFVYKGELITTSQLELKITGNPTEWTNQDVTLTVTVEDAEGATVITLPNGEVYAGTSTAFIVTANGEYTFKAQNGGTVLEETVTVTKIDKTPPPKPSVKIGDGVILPIKAVIDNESGIDKLYLSTNLSPEVWTPLNFGVAISGISLGGNYTFKFKTVDKAGNESEIVSVDIIVIRGQIKEDNPETRLQVATEAVEKAETSKLQEDINAAKGLVEALPDSSEKQELILRLNIVEATVAVELAENSRTIASWNAARDLVFNLSDSSAKDDLLARLDAVQLIIEATTAVEKAEYTYLQSDVDDARDLVEALPDSLEKSDLLARLDALQQKIDYNKALQKALQAVIEAENNPTQANIDNARNLVNAMPDGAAKTALHERLDAVQVIVQVMVNLDEIEFIINGLDTDSTQEELDNAQQKLSQIQELIDTISDETFRDNLQRLLDIQQGCLDDLLEAKCIVEKLKLVNSKLEEITSELADISTLEELETIRGRLDELMELVYTLPLTDRGNLSIIIGNIYNSLETLEDNIKAEEIRGMLDALSDGLDNLEDNPTESDIDEIRTQISIIETKLNDLREDGAREEITSILNELKTRLNDIEFNYEASKGIEITEGWQIINVGQRVQLTHTSKLPVVWESSDSNIVSVTEDGRIEAISVGTATITVTIEGTIVSDSITVTVKEDVINVTDFEIEEESIDLKVGERYTLEFSVTPSNATNKAIEWESSDSAVAVVVNGEVTAVGAGIATIIGITVDGEYSDYVVVNVTEDTEDPEDPEDPEEPGEPGDPEEPEEPGDTEDPEEPGDTEEPEEPGDTEDPEEPGDTPEEPEEPGDTEEPENPVEPEEPGDTEDPEEPVEPSEPVRPTRPSDNSKDNEKIENSKEYKENYEKLLNSIPYTILKDSEVDWNKVLGIKSDILDVTVDTSKTGKATVTVKLMGVTSTFIVEIVGLAESKDAVNNIPTNHWAESYISQVVSKGYIQGGTNGDLMLNDTLRIADSFAALDRLLLNNGLVGNTTNRGKVDELTKDIKDTWYTDPVKSILSRYNEEALSKFNLDGNFERPITREEVAQIIYNSLYGRVELTQEMKNYDDITTVNNYEAIEFCTRAGILTGYPDNTVRPQGLLTRVEFITILAKIDSILNK